jgi:hypothetical protein
MINSLSKLQRLQRAVAPERSGRSGISTGRVASIIGPGEPVACTLTTNAMDIARHIKTRPR